MKLIAATLLVVIALSGCGGLPRVEVCYEHPTYGRVCVVLGEKYYEKSLSPVEKAEFENQIKNGTLRPKLLHP